MPSNQALKTLDAFGGVHLSIPASVGASGMARGNQFNQSLGVRLPGATHGARKTVSIRVNIRVSPALTEARGNRQRDEGARSSESRHHGSFPLAEA